MTYPGGKGGAGVYQTIINQQPPHHTYTEPFLGAGSVLLHKLPARANVGIDLDRSAIARMGGARGIALVCADGISYLRNHRWSTFDLVYCDPPYMMETLSRDRAIYAHEMTAADHGRLLDVLRALPCMVQLSGYYSRLYAEKLHGWRLLRFQATTRGGLREECLWMNYPEPTALHDYRYLGQDFRQRERIARKVRRWRDRLKTLPHLERQALLSQIAG